MIQFLPSEQELYQGPPPTIDLPCSVLHETLPEKITWTWCKRDLKCWNKYHEMTFEAGLMEMAADNKQSTLNVDLRQRDKCTYSAISAFSMLWTSFNIQNVVFKICCHIISLVYIHTLAFFGHDPSPESDLVVASELKSSVSCETPCNFGTKNKRHLFTKNRVSPKKNKTFTVSVLVGRQPSWIHATNEISNEFQPTSNRRTVVHLGSVQHRHHHEVHVLHVRKCNSRNCRSPARFLQKIRKKINWGTNVVNKH